MWKSWLLVVTIFLFPPACDFSNLGLDPADARVTVNAALTIAGVTSVRAEITGPGIGTIAAELVIEGTKASTVMLVPIGPQRLLTVSAFAGDQLVGVGSLTFDVLNDGFITADVELRAAGDAGAPYDAVAGTDMLSQDLTSDVGSPVDRALSEDAGSSDLVVAADVSPDLSTGVDAVEEDAGPAVCDGQPDFTPCVVVTSLDRSYDICMSGVCVSPGCGDVSCNVVGAHFTLPDTGVRACYNSVSTVPCPGIPGDPSCATTAFCGQDGQLGWSASNAEADRFEIREVAPSGYVTDLITGLVWTRCAAGKEGFGCDQGAALQLNWSDAIAYCEVLDLAGFSDWRLPDEFELLSTVDFEPSGMACTYTDTAFPAAPYAQPHWSSSTFAGNSDWAWQFDRRLGVLNFSLKNELRHLRCVRGTPRPRPTHLSRSEPVAGQPMVVDGVSGLTWQGCPAGRSDSDCGGGSASTKNWNDALAYCQDLTWGGSSDWTLPNIIELRSIVDNRRTAGNAIFPDYFPGAPSGASFWSSTTHKSGNGCRLNAGSGALSYSGKAEEQFVRCVRYP